MTSTKTKANTFVFQDESYSFQLLRALSGTVNEAADIGECLLTAQAIEENNDESWHEEWLKLARRVEKLAETYYLEEHKESARTAYLRASNYYRTAEFYLHCHKNDPRIVQTWAKGRNCFKKSVALGPFSINDVRIPFESTTLPGYFCISSDLMKPLLIIQTGFDGTAEELYYQVGRQALLRGYHVLLFEGPGQGEMIREKGIPFRPDWEKVISAVIDFALTKPHIDPERIGLMGISFGGYLVPRALAFEKRVKAAIVNGGIYDFHQVCMKKGLNDKDLDDTVLCKEIDEAIINASKNEASLRWACGNGMYTFQAQSPTDWLKKTRPYHLKNIIQNIQTPILILDSDEDEIMADQSQIFYEHLTCPKTFIEFKSQEGASLHCQIGAYALSNEQSFNWLDQTL